MTNERQILLNWAAEGKIEPDNLAESLKVCNASPLSTSWINFLRLSMMWLGIVAVSSGVIFFFAYNWQEMSRLTKFSLIEISMVLSAIVYVRLSSNPLITTATLMGMTLLTGGLLALVGQSYQTGADPWQLFAIWSLLMLPWAVISRSNVLWIFWLVLVNLSAALFMDVNYYFAGMIFNDIAQTWVFALLNSSLLIGFEVAEYIKITKTNNKQSFKLKHRYVHQLLAFSSGIAVTFVAINALFESRAGFSGIAFYLGWLLLGFYYYFKRQTDLFILSSIIFSLITFVASLLIKLLDSWMDSGGFLLISIAIIGLSTFAGLWLKKLANTADFNQHSAEKLEQI